MILEKNGAIGPMTPSAAGCCGGRCKSAAELSYPSTQEEADQIDGVDLVKKLVDTVCDSESAKGDQSEAD